jgi:hypothetical protein
MASTIAIITLSLIVAFLCWKLIPLSIEVGEYRENRRINVEPEIEYHSRENKELWWSIEKIIAGDQYAINHCKEIIQQKKESKKYIEKMLFKND